MNTEYIIKNSRFEILKPYHNISSFKSKSKSMNKFLTQKALKEQSDGNKVTHLVFCDDKLIAFFTIYVYFEGMPKEDYLEINNVVNDLPDIEKLPHAVIKKFAIDEEYEDYLLASAIFDNIVFNLNNIFKKCYDFEGLVISVGDECLLPSNENVESDEIENDVELDFLGLDDDKFFIAKVKR